MHEGGPADVGEHCDVGGIAPADPCLLVIFGGSGDLARRKLLPSLYNMMRQGLLPEGFAVVGTGGTPISDYDYRKRLTDAVAEFVGGGVDQDALERLRKATYYHTGRLTEAGDYDPFKRHLDDIAKRHGTRGNLLFYLATPPEYFAPIVERIGAAGMVSAPDDASRWTRLIVEKPFGRDLDSARDLNRKLLAVFDERQIHRIDHYLGKETVQNLLLLRFVNGIFEPIWNRRYVDSVQITVAEKIGAEGRGAYYDSSGTMRDMVQNHMFQLLCLVAMEPPIALESEAVRNEKVKVLEAIRPMSRDQIARHTVRGQYGPGEVEGKAVPGFRQEPHVAADSRTDTYTALELHVENWRWADVPFYLRTGKRLPARDTQIVIQFRRAPLLLLPDIACDQPNRLTIHVQPEESITLRFHAKSPGPVIRLAPVEMRFAYSDLEGRRAGTGYETLLYDCMTGDTMLFHRTDMVEAAWKIATPILEAWESTPAPDLPNYAAGTWGPRAGDELIARSGRRWIPPVRS